MEYFKMENIKEFSFSSIFFYLDLWDIVMLCIKFILFNY